MVPPHSLEAEQAVIGGLLLDNEKYEAVGDLLTPEDFYRRDHKILFRAIAEMVDSGEPCDLVTLSEFLKGDLEDAGGLEYIGSLVRDTPSSENVRAYAEVVKDKSVLRQLLHSAYQTIEEIRDGDSVADILDAAELRLTAAETHKEGFADLKAALSGTLDRIDEMFQNPNAIVGLPTGLEKLDEFTNGLHRGDLIIVAGRPSSGKTALSVNIAEHAAMSGVPTAIFSLEMSTQQILLRILSSLGRIDQKILLSGRLEDLDWDRLTSAMSRLTPAPLYIDDTAALTPAEMKARARRLARECRKKHGRPLGLVVVDYIQLMQTKGHENRATEVAEISRSLKQLAKELDCPVVALSQLNRKVDDRPGKKPVMSDLRESGAIEQDADVILFVSRSEETPNVADIIIGKQRNGPTGDFRATFLGKYTRFENYMPEYT